MKKLPKVFVVVLNWNRVSDTLECLRSLVKLQTPNFKLQTVVVDNNSTESISKIKNIKGIVVLENRKNLGFAGGNNVGIKYALKQGADYVMVLNNDVIADKDLVGELLKVAQKTNKFGVASPKIYFAKGFEFHKDRYGKSELGKVIWYAGGKIDWKNVYGSARGVDEVDNGQFDKVMETDFATGACMFLSADVLKNVGMYDEKYFMYYEDTDLSVRLKKAGYAVVYVPKAKLWHKVAQSSGIGSNLNDYFTTRNRMLFGMRYTGFRTQFALIRESIRLAFTGRLWQKIGAFDFYVGRFGKGSYK